jgi:hypothetical protein
MLPAITPNNIKTSAKPNANKNVLFIISLLSIFDWCAKYAGNSESEHGARNDRIPAINEVRE